MAEPTRDFEADLRLCEDAEPGPWKQYGDRLSSFVGTSHDEPRVVCEVCMAFQDNWADGQFIAAAREGWPAAIAEVLRLRSEVEGLKKANALLMEDRCT